MPVASIVVSPSNAPRQLSDGNDQGTVLGYGGTLPTGLSDKISFFGAAPTPQAAFGPNGNTAITAAGSVTAVFANTTFTGVGSGVTSTTAYTIGDVVNALKLLGLLP